MKKVLKITGKVLLGLLILIVLLLVIMAVYNQIIMNGNRVLFKRVRFERFLDQATAI